jgi:hypothetical protein
LATIGLQRDRAKVLAAALAAVSLASGLSACDSHKGVPQTSTVAPQQASCDALGINRTERKEGTCVRDEDGRRYTVVNKTSTLRLKTLKARFVAMRQADSVSSHGMTEAAHGTYVIITVAITNRLDIPVRFGRIGGPQTVLVPANNKNFSESSNAENKADSHSFFSNDQPIQPGDTRVGDVVFDVPRSPLKYVDKPGAILDIVNFGKSVEDDSDSVGTVGSIRVSG